MGTKIPPVATGGVDPGVRVNVSSGVIDMASLPVGVGGFHVEALILAGTAGDHDFVMQLNGATTGYTTGDLWSAGVSTSASITGNFGGGANTNGFALGRAGNDASRSGILVRLDVWPTNGTDTVYVTGTSTSFALATGVIGIPADNQIVGVYVPSAAITEIKFLRADGSSSGILAGSFGVWQKLSLTA